MADAGGSNREQNPRREMKEQDGEIGGLVWEMIPSSSES